MTSEQILDRLQRQCSRREYCTRDVLTKALKALEGDRDAAEKIVSSLVRDKYVDDRRYCSAFAREKAHLTGWGPVKIVHALAAKGISMETARAALKEIDAPAAGKKLQKLLETKYRTVKDMPDARLRLLRYGLSRGYEYDEVDSVCRSLVK